MPFLASPSQHPTSVVQIFQHGLRCTHQLLGAQHQQQRPACEDVAIWEVPLAAVDRLLAAQQVPGEVTSWAETPPQVRGL